MIKIQHLTKQFESKKALADVSFTIEDGSVFGLVGTNGAGKSTLLRILAGVYQADEGQALLDDMEPYDNAAVKSKTLFIPDSPYFFPQSTVRSMAGYYRSFYPDWSEAWFEKCCKAFSLDISMKINIMSKGMQRQAALILGLATQPKYILFDEIFDGLDPVIRGVLKRILVDFVAEKQATVIIASHNLRELEDLCDHVGLLHNGSILFEKDLDELKWGIFRVQVAFEANAPAQAIQEALKPMKWNENGKVITFTVKGDKDQIINMLSMYRPLLCEVLPLTLEEVFISEMEYVGYDSSHVLR